MNKKYYKTLIILLLVISFLLTSCNSENAYIKDLDEVNLNNETNDVDANEEDPNKFVFDNSSNKSFTKPTLKKIDETLPYGVDNFDRSNWVDTKDYVIESIKYLTCDIESKYLPRTEQPFDLFRYEQKDLEPGYIFKNIVYYSDEEFDEIKSSNYYDYNRTKYNDVTIYSLPEYEIGQKVIDCYNDVDNANRYLYFDGWSMLRQYKYYEWYGYEIVPAVARIYTNDAIFYKYSEDYNPDTHEASYMTIYIPYYYLSYENKDADLSLTQKINDHQSIFYYDGMPYVVRYFIEINLNKN